jgi:ribonuclease HI
MLKLVCRIRQFIEKWDLETPHPTLPPWTQKSHISTDIPTESKEAVATTHTLRIPALLQDPQVRVYYTDGSQGLNKKEEKQCSAAYCKLEAPDSVSTWESWNLGNRVEVADTEVFAVAKVMQVLTRDPGITQDLKTIIHIFVDSQAAILRIRNPKGNRWAQRIQNTARALRRRAEIRISWCPGHCGIFGNEAVDARAKEALEKPATHEAYTSTSYIKRLVKAKGLQKWRDIWDSEALKGERAKGLGKLYQEIARDSLRFNFKPQLLNLPRKHQAAFIQLKTGIGYLATHQKRVGNTPNDTCFGRCTARQTTQHLILECKLYRNQRASIARALRKARIPLTLQALFNTTAGRDALQPYLLSTKVCTAHWFYHMGAEEALA